MADNITPSTEKTVEAQTAGSAAPRFIATLSTLSDSQVEAIRAIPPLSSFKLPVMTKRRPVDLFISRERFELEQERVFRRQPVPITVSALLPEPGSVVTHNDYGLPLLLVRGKDGEVRCFLNACQHKGAKIVEKCEPHKLARLTCPYHSWTYALDGRLIAVARDDVFDELDKRTLGLAELPVREFGGMIWAILDRDAEADFSVLEAALGEDLERLRIPQAHVYARRIFNVKANWKLIMEPFQENYHVRRLHANSIGDMFVDGAGVVTPFGRHQRKIYGKGNFDSTLLEDPKQDIHKIVTHIYQLFPNGILITSPYYTSLMILMPRSEGETSVEYFMLTPGAAQSEKVENLYARSYELIQKVFGGEDFRAAEISQVGLASGALKEVIYGGMEITIPAYYDRLDASMAK